MAASLTTWVSDRLYDLLGLSDSYTAEFLIGTARKCSSEQLFLKKLKDTGALRIDDSVVSFASELWTKVPHKNVDSYIASREKERAAVLQRQKNKTYSLLSDDDEDDTSSAQRKNKRKSKGERKEEKAVKRKRNIRKEKAAAWESESEDDDENGAKKKDDSDSDEWEK